MSSTTQGYGRPGVSVQEVLTPRDTGFATTTASRAVLLADLDRGPAEPMTVGSWFEFRQIYGDWSDNKPRVPFGHKRNASVDAAYLYFANNPTGGAPLSIVRVVNADAQKAVGSLEDPSGNDVISVTALAPGTWGNNLKVELLGTYTVAGPFDPASYNESEFQTPLGYGTGTLELIVSLRDANGVYQVVERFASLSLNEQDRRYVDFVVNGASRFISVESGTGNLATVSERAFTLGGGGDGDTPADLSKVLESLDFWTGALVISYSGHWNSADLGLVSAYCKKRGDSFHVIDTPDLGNSVRSIAEWVDELNDKSSFGAVYYPPAIINDPAAGPNNVRRQAAIGGAVLGVFIANDVSYGMWKTPAGVTAGVRGIISPAYRFSNPQLDEMNLLTHPVNPIRVINGVGTCIMGGRTLSQTHADRYVGVRRSFSYIRSRLEALTEFALFEVNGPDLWDTITTRLENFLGLYYQQGALRGAREYEAFYVLCDETNNNTNTISAGEVHIEVGVAIEYPAEFVVIKLTHNQTSVRVD